MEHQIKYHSNRRLNGVHDSLPVFYYYYHYYYTFDVHIPLQLCATLGTTGACAFDKLEELGPICKCHTRIDLTIVSVFCYRKRDVFQATQKTCGSTWTPRTREQRSYVPSSDTGSPASRTRTPWRSTRANG